MTRGLSVARAIESQARDEFELLREGTRAEDIAEARALLAEAQQTLDLLQAGTRQEEISEAEATVAAARAAVAVIQRQIAELIVRWRRHYNTVRLHSALGYRPPAPEAIGVPPSDGPQPAATADAAPGAPPQTPPGALPLDPGFFPPRRAGKEQTWI